MKKYLLRTTAAVIAFAFLSLPIFAQKGTYAIKDAEVVTVSGSVIPVGTVVIRDGLIESVGPSVRVPADAKVLDGQGLTVYPGFFDAYTKLGIAKPRPSSQQSGASSGPAASSNSNSNYPSSLQPQDKVSDSLKAGEDQFASHRNAGFTTVVTGTSDGIFNGYSAVINLAGDTVSSMIVRSPFAQQIAFKTQGRGLYPSSLMGTFSAMRQMFNDAKRLDQLKQMYAKNPRGMKRPEADSALEALIPVVRGEMPVVVYANTEREIIRTLDLTKEYGLKTIIAGGLESGKAAARLKAQNIPVLLSLDFPLRSLSDHKEVDPESLETLRQRVEAPKNAAKLKSAGVKFAFQSDTMKSIKDFVKNAGTAVENGLGRADAIRAMTLSSAEIIGVDQQLGSIETGKIANIVVVKGDLFDKESLITHVFVDGKLFEQPKKKETPKSTGDKDGPPISAEGTWNITIDAPGISIPATLELTQSGDSISGTMSSQTLGTATIRNGSISGTGFTFDVTVNFQGTDLDLSVSANVDGDTIEGTVDTEMGPAPFSGSRVPSAKF